MAYATPQPITGDPHSAAKRLILHRFLQRWVPIMGQGQDTITYVDSFSGSGSEEVDDSVIKGSPVIALEVILGYINRVNEMRSRDKERGEEHPLSLSALREVRLILIEKDPGRFQMLKEALRNVVSSRSQQAVVTFADESQGPNYPGQFPAFNQPCAPVGVAAFTNSFCSQESATVVLDCLNTEFEEVFFNNFCNIFAFIDPFGYKDIPMTKISEILDQPRSEVLVNFMSGFINRFKGRKNAKIRETLDNLFGSDLWRGYQEREKSQQRQFLIDCYVESLIEIGGAPYTVRFEIRGRNNAVIYHLIYATKHWKGLEAMKESMNRMTQDGSGENLVFSDFIYKARVRDQSFNSPLAKQQDDKGPVANMIIQQFIGKSVTIQDVHKFVVVATPFLFRKATLKYLLVERKAIKSVWRTDGNTYIRATFPDECTEMEFLPWGITWNAANYIVHLLSYNYTADCTIREIEDNLKGTPSCFENHKHILANLETNGVVRITNPEGYRRSGAFADHYFVSLA